MSVPDWLRFVARLSRRRHYPEVVAVLLSTAAVIFGATLAFNPTAYTTRTTYASAMDFASPHAWAAVFIAAGALLAAAVVWARSVALWPAGGLSVLWGSFAAFMFDGAIDGGVPSPAVGYTLLSWVTLALAAVYWTDGEELEHAGP